MDDLILCIFDGPLASFLEELLDGLEFEGNVCWFLGFDEVGCLGGTCRLRERNMEASGFLFLGGGIGEPGVSGPGTDVSEFKWTSGCAIAEAGLGDVSCIIGGDTITAPVSEDNDEEDLMVC